MRILLILLAVVVVVGVAVGFYRGWFRVSAQSEEGKSDVTLTVDKGKMVTDKDTAVDKVQDLGHDAVN